MTRRLIGSLAMGAAALVLLGVGGQSLARVWQMKQEVASLEREIGQLRSETDRLSTDIGRLRTDPDYIEQVAREILGFVKPGERVLKLPPSPAAAPAAPGGRGGGG
jgi:cell division protein FtsB